LVKSGLIEKATYPNIITGCAVESTSRNIVCRDNANVSYMLRLDGSTASQYAEVYSSCGTFTGSPALASLLLILIFVSALLARLVFIVCDLRYP